MQEDIRNPRHLDDPVKIYGLSGRQWATFIVGAVVGGVVWWLLAHIGVEAHVTFTVAVLALGVNGLAVIYLASGRKEPYFRQLRSYLARPHLSPATGRPLATTERGRRAGGSAIAGQSSRLLVFDDGVTVEGMHVFPDGVVRLADGRERAYLKVGKITLEGRPLRDQLLLAEDLAHLATTLAPGQHVQILIDNRSVEAPRVLRQYAALHHPAGAALDELFRHKLSWLSERLTDTHSPAVTYYVIVEAASYVVAGLEGMLQGRRPPSDRTGLEQALGNVEAALQKMELGYEQLRQRAVVELLWSTLHVSGAPCPADRVLRPHETGTPRAPFPALLRRVARRHPSFPSVAWSRAGTTLGKVYGQYKDPEELLLLSKRLHLVQRGKRLLRRRPVPVADTPVADTPVADTPTAAAPPRPPRHRRGISPLHEQLTAVTMRERPHYMEIDGQFCRTLFVLRQPDIPQMGWLDRMISLPFRTRIALSWEGLDRDDELKRLVNRLGQFHDLNLDRQSRGAVADPFMAQASAEINRLLEDMGDVAHRIMRMGIYVTVFARSRAELEQRVQQAKSILRYSRCEVGNGLWAQYKLFQSTLPVNVDTAGLSYRTISRAAGLGFPFIEHSPGHISGLLIGFTPVGHELVWYDPTAHNLPNSLVNIVGMSGSGKTMLALNLAAQTLARRRRVTVVDKARHYEPLCRLVGGSYVRFLAESAPGEQPAINPWEYVGRVQGTQVKDVLALHQVMLGRTTRNPLDAWQVALLDEGIRAVFARHADGSIPLERELVAWLWEQAAGRPERREAIETLAYGLHPYIGQGEFAPFIDQPTNIAVDTDLLVFDVGHLSGAQSAVALILVTALVDWRNACLPPDPLADRSSRDLLVIDEMWFLIKYAGGGEWLQRLARTGRHMGLFAVFLTQELSDELDDPEAISLFNAIPTHFLLRQSNERVGESGGLEWIGKRLQLNDTELRQLAGLRSVRGAFSQALMIVKDNENAKPRRGLVNIIVSPWEYQLFASHRDERETREAAEAESGGDMAAAIRKLVQGDRASRVPRAVRKPRAVAGKMVGR